MIPIGNECRTTDLFAYLHAKERHCFIANEPYHRRNHYDAYIVHLLGMKESIDRHISGEHGAEQDSQDDNDPREVFHTTIAIRKSRIGFPSREQESNPQWYSGRGIAEIVEGVTKKGNTSG